MQHSVYVFYVCVALFLLDDCHSVYLWIGRRPTHSEGTEDETSTETVGAGTAAARFTAAKICALKTTLNYCLGMLEIIFCCEQSSIALTASTNDSPVHVLMLSC